MDQQQHNHSEDPIIEEVQYQINGQHPIQAPGQPQPYDDGPLIQERQSIPQQDALQSSQQIEDSEMADMSEIHHHDQSEQPHEDEEQMSYRMVRRKYFCYVCQKEFATMMSAYEPINCEGCHQGFVELIEKHQGATAVQEDVDEEKRRFNEQYRMGANDAPRIQGNRLDLYDRTTESLYGVPNERRRAEERKRKELEEEKKRDSLPQQPSLARQRSNNNPYRPQQGPHGNFILDFLTGSPYFMGFGPEVRHGPFQRQSSRFRNPFGGSGILSEDQFLGNFFRPFSFGSMFDDDDFSGMSSFFGGFNPHNFATNFSQNFRSSGSSFGDDLLQRVMEMSAAQHQHKKPTQKEAIKKLPVVEIQECHCKKSADGSQLETPICTVCQENLNLGSKALFLPCGHTFHPDCIMPWLKDHNTCPICRYELPTDA